MSQEIYLSRKEVERLLNINRRKIQRACKSGRFKTILIQGNGGMQYQIALFSLPADGQVRWVEENKGEAKGLTSEQIALLSPEARGAVARCYVDDKDTGKGDIHMVDGNKKDIKASAIKEYLMDPCYRTAEKIGKEINVHPSTVYRWVEGAKNRVDREAVITVCNENVRIKLPKCKISEDVFTESLNIILLHQRARISQGHEYLIQKGQTISYCQYTRLLNQMDPSFNKILKYRRSGRVAALLSDTPKIIRSWTQLPVMNTVVGDQHYMDYYFYEPQTDDVVKIYMG